MTESCNRTMAETQSPCSDSSTDAAAWLACKTTYLDY